MDKYEEYIDSEIKKLDKKEIARMSKELKKIVDNCHNILTECILLNSGEKTSPTSWSLAIVSCLLELVKIDSNGNIDKFDFIIKKHLLQISVMKDKMMESWDE